jgi:copper(I)-binding protein
MTLKSLIAAAAATLTLATPALADILIHDAYARSSGMMAKSGAAFLVIENTGDADHLISATSDAAKRVELHTHLENAEGVMQMVHVEEGFEIPAGGMVMLERGGKHVMFMGLTAPFVDGKEITVTLIFRDAGEITVTVPVDLTRQPGQMMHGSN